MKGGEILRKIIYILPAVGKKPGERYISTWKMEPLPLATIAALASDDWETEFFDDRIELIDYETETDLVAISVETYTALRAYRIAEKFRRRGIPVVMGGYHPTHMPEEASRFADSVVVGNAENVMSKLLDDVRDGRLQKLYAGQPGYKVVLPNRNIYRGRDYISVGLVETGRGCHHSCDFCHITTYYNATYHPRPIPDVIDDIKSMGQKFYFLIDDNFIANPAYSIDLCKELAKLKISWFGQASVNVARNDELLYWVKKSGCVLLLVGFESLDAENLRQMNKAWSVNSSDRDQLVRKIHSAGISMYASFIFGHDNDTPETLERSVDFALKHNFFFAAFNHLIPFPKTPLYEKLLSEGRLANPEWWLDENYKFGDIPYIPKRMAPEELKERCVDARHQFYGGGSIIKRGIALLGRSPALALVPLFFSANKHLGKDVYGRDSLPLGKGLDELPK